MFCHDKFLLRYEVLKLMDKLKLKTFTVGDNFVVTENESIAILKKIANKYN